MLISIFVEILMNVIFQIVIQIEDRHGVGGGMGIDSNGCILIRTDDHRKGFCPVSHLQEV